MSTKTTTAPTQPLAPGALTEMVHGIAGTKLLEWPEHVSDAAYGAIIPVLAANPHAKRKDADRLAAEVWARVREMPCGGRGRTFSQEIRVAGVSSITVHLAGVILALLDLGPLTSTLRRQQEAIATTLAQLEALHDVGRGPA